MQSTLGFSINQSKETWLQKLFKLIKLEKNNLTLRYGCSQIIEEESKSVKDIIDLVHPLIFHPISPHM